MHRTKRWILSSAGVVLALLLILGLWWLHGGPRLWTQRQFAAHRAAFEATAEAALAGGPWEDVPGVRELDVWPQEGAGGVEPGGFSPGGWGAGSSPPSLGIYCTTDGGPAGFQGTDMVLTEDAVGEYSWQEEDGDNHYKTWCLEDGWYGYLMEF